MEGTTSESSEPPVIYPDIKKFDKQNPVPQLAPEGFILCSFKFNLLITYFSNQLRP